MNTAPSIDRSAAAAANKRIMRADYSLGFDAFPAEMRKLLKWKVAEQNSICAICHEEFTDYNDVVPDHSVA